ncbi:MAG: hypothetical protein JWM73_2431 [Solirubrobacterales bacterium]|nr:hypothetical protein [Solirubrobacterales bacterium]
MSLRPSSLVAAVCVPALCAVLAAQAVAGTVAVSGRVAPGAFSVSGVPHTVKVPPLTGRHSGWRRAVVWVPVTVTDARGTGAGWSLSLSAAMRTTAGDRARHVHVSVWQMDVRCAGCTAPRARVVLPMALPEQTPVRAFTAGQRTGMGRMRLMAKLVISAPLSAPRGHYVLRPTISRVVGP